MYARQCVNRAIILFNSSMQYGLLHFMEFIEGEQPIQGNGSPEAGLEFQLEGLFYSDQTANA